MATPIIGMTQMVRARALFAPFEETKREEAALFTAGMLIDSGVIRKPDAFDINDAIETFPVSLAIVGSFLTPDPNVAAVTPASITTILKEVAAIFPVAKPARLEPGAAGVITVQDAATSREKENFIIHAGMKWPRNPSDSVRWLYPSPWLRMRWQGTAAEPLAALWTQEVLAYFRKEGADIPVGQDPKLEALLTIIRSFLKTTPSAAPAGVTEPHSILSKETLDSWFRTIDLIVELVIIWKSPRLRTASVTVACAEFWSLIAAATKSSSTALDYVDITKTACEKNGKGRQ